MGLDGGAAGRGVRRVMLCGVSGRVQVLPVSVRPHLLGGERVSGCGAGLEMMSHSRLLSLPVSCRLSRRRLRTYGWSWGAGSLRGWTPWGWSASASMASDAACDIHPPTGWSRQFSAYSLLARRTRPSKEGSVQALFRSSQSCVWVQRYHHGPRAGPWPWAEVLVWAWVCVVG